jgi:glycosyltransferase involved in cell wall biosynthesis
VATRAGGIPEVVKEGVDGFLADVGDVDAMAKHAIALGKSREMRMAMGKAGRKSAEASFHPDRIVPQYEALYAAAIGK